MKSINPSTGEVIREYESTSEEAVENRLRMAHAAQRGWKGVSIARRAEFMFAMADTLRADQDPAAELISLEMGKPIRESRAEVEKCAWVCEYYARHAERFLADCDVETDAGRSYISYEPLGLILCIMPWNFPFWQVFRFAAPSTMAGNATILKHAGNVSGVALLIEELFVKAGFPTGLFATLLLPGERAEALVEHPLIQGVTLTGSDRAGRKVGGHAGRFLKKSVLELGGSDPFIVLADADIPAAARAGAEARSKNSGQSCIAAKRFIVERPIAAEFTDALTAELEAQRMGNPLEEPTDIGPLARDDLRETLHRQVEQSIDGGAKCLIGGVIPGGSGYFYPPTVLTNVKPGVPAFDDETFGPVAAVTVASDANEAVSLANQTRYGLGASLWTADRERGDELSHEIDAGCVFVNQIVKSDPRMPFGGIKMSGFGRELSSEGIREFVNRKTVWID